MAIKSNQNGSKGELIVQNLFRDLGYWAHVTQRSRSGSQPIDIIAAKGHEYQSISYCPTTWFVDSKYVEHGDRFDFDDIQPNQIESLRYIRDFAKIKGELGFAIMFGDFDDKVVYFLPFEMYENVVSRGMKSVHMQDFGTIQEWEREALWIR